MMDASPTARPSGRLSCMWQRLVLPNTTRPPREMATAPLPDAHNRPPRTRIIVAAASVPSVLSLIWFASTVAETIGGPGGWAAGVFADVLIVSTVAVAWFNPEVRRLAGFGGWVAAVAAGVLLGWHY